MKFSCLLLASLCSSALAVAQSAPTGYCRIQNVDTKRYLYVIDNKSTSADYSAGTFDCGAIEPYSGLSKAISDPASVIDIVYVSGSQYRFDAQGTSTTQIVGNYPVHLTKYSDGSFMCWASHSGLTRYLADVQDDLTQERGSIDVKTNTENNYRYWNILPIDVNSDNYFGIKPTISVDGKYYAPFYASFAFSTASDGMKVYIITAQKGGKAILSQVSADVIPGGFPVLIECASTDPANNKLNILSNSTSVLDGNLLKGNYFRYQRFRSNGEELLNEPHRNVTPYDLSTDRIFGITSDGKLGLVTPTDEYIPANYPYLRSSDENLPSEVLFVSKGDPNGDSSINISDVTSTIDVIANSSLDSSFKEVYDINDDDVVNIADVTSLINKISNE